MSSTDYEQAWNDEAEKKVEKKPVVDHVVAAVKAASKAEAAEFEDAFKNDRFGIDIESVANADGKQKEGESND